MKKSIPLACLSLLLICCSPYKTVFSKEEPSTNDLQIIKSLLKKDNNLLTFIEYFEDDKILMYVDENLIFDETITTDKILGASKGVEFPSSASNIILKINNKDEIKIKNKDNYRLIYLLKKDGKYIVTYSKKVIKFY